MKKIAFVCLITTLAFSIPNFARAQGNPEAAKLARQGAEAAKDQDWDKAIESLRKAHEMDRKFGPNLAAAYQQRGFASANDRKFPEAIADFGEALKVSPRDAGIYEQRAAVEMKINDLDKALADYSEAIKLNSHEVKYYLYRGYIYESKADWKNSMADTEKALKIDKKNAEAISRKTRLEARMKAAGPAPAPTKAP